MPYILGIDTGGTFTDGAIVRFPEAIVLHQAKTPTTHDNLCDCIRNCIRSFDPTVRDQIRLVSLSTTLATNALVEGRGCTEGLILMGGDVYKRQVLLCRVSPFGHPRIKAHLRLPVAFRSLSRPSSALSAKAFPLRPLQLDQLLADISSISRIIRVISVL